MGISTIFRPFSLSSLGCQLPAAFHSAKALRALTALRTGCLLCNNAAVPSPRFLLAFQTRAQTRQLWSRPGLARSSWSLHQTRRFPHAKRFNECKHTGLWRWSR